METQGPILASFSIPSTNSDITLKIIQLLAPLISAQSLSLNAVRMRSSSSATIFNCSSFVVFFFLFISHLLVAKYTNHVMKRDRGIAHDGIEPVRGGLTRLAMTSLDRKSVVKGKRADRGR